MYVYEPLKFVESIAFPRFGGTSEERRAAEIIKAETPEGYADDAAIKLTYALRNAPDGEIVATKSEIIPYRSPRWDTFITNVEAGGLVIDDTDQLIGIREKQTYKKVAGNNGYCYTNIVEREFIGVA